jgi:hypothetical protein
MIEKASGRVLAARYFLNAAMIRGTRLPVDLILPLAVLEDSWRHFFLTGSFSERQIINPKDIDFFVLDSQALRNELRNKGFEDVFNERDYAGDSSICRTFRFRSLDSKMGEISHIDVQLIHPHHVASKLGAQIIFEKLSPHLQNDKQVKKEVWRILLGQ